MNGVTGETHGIGGYKVYTLKKTGEGKAYIAFYIMKLSPDAKNLKKVVESGSMLIKKIK